MRNNSLILFNFMFLLLLIISSSVAFSESPQNDQLILKSYVINEGGGKSENSQVTLQSSVGEVPAGFTFNTQLDLVAGWIPTLKAGEEFGQVKVVAINYPDSIAKGEDLSWKIQVENGTNDTVYVDQLGLEVSGPASVKKTIWQGKPIHVLPGMTMTSPKLSIKVANPAPSGRYYVDNVIYFKGNEIARGGFYTKVY
jgi:hypothetical protein